MAPATKAITVKIVFGNSVRDDSGVQKLVVSVKEDGSDSIHELKALVAAAAGGQVTADDLLLSFGPVDRKMGRQYAGDPNVDEHKLRLAEYSVMQWLERFPSWTLSARLLPAAPPPPGVAIKRAAAVAEQKDPDRAVQDARSKGEIPKINDLPAPWGPKPFTPPPAEELTRDGYLPARYPQESLPSVTGA